MPPCVRSMELTQATVNGFRADYVQRPAVSERARRTVREGAQRAAAVDNDPETLVRIADFKVVDGEIG
jgi:hypothetical protein